MRHFISPRAIAAASRRMLEAALAGLLVALAGRALRFASRSPSTVVGAIDLAAIARAANEYLCAATRTEKESGGRFHRHARSSRRDVDEISKRWDTLLAPVHNTAPGTT